MTRPTRFIAVRNMTIATILVLVGWLIARTWVACSAVIVSGSMAPALLGPHLVATCPACRQTTKVGVAEETRQYIEAGHPLACQNCGMLIHLPADTPISSGDSLLVRRNLELDRPLDRGDLLACQDPESPEKTIVKRLVGLPGETVQIIEGDLFINGQIARKSFEQQASTAVLVYDADCETDPPLPELPRRWTSPTKDSRWSAKEGRFHFAGSKPEKNTEKNAEEKTDRLTYHHRCRVDGQMVAGAVVDRLPYNQWLPIRRDAYNPVPDLMLTFHLSRIAGEGRLKIFTTGDRYVVTFDYGKKKIFVESLQREPKLLAEASFSPPSGSVPILVSTIDRRLMIVVDQDVVLDEPLPEPLLCTSTPFSLEAVELALSVSRVRLYRDVYYARPIGITARWAFDKPVHLGENEYFILGDNSRISQDSRTWPQGPAIQRSAIFGRP